VVVLAEPGRPRSLNSRYPKRKKQKELLWVVDSREELEEFRLFGPVIEEGPGGSSCSVRGRLRQGGIRARVSLLSEAEIEET
jgi:hypothetical protein